MYNRLRETWIDNCHGSILFSSSRGDWRGGGGDSELGGNRFQSLRDARWRHQPRSLYFFDCEIEVSVREKGTRWVLVRGGMFTGLLIPPWHHQFGFRRVSWEHENILVHHALIILCTKSAVQPLKLRIGGGDLETWPVEIRKSTLQANYQPRFVTCVLNSCTGTPWGKLDQKNGTG